jgi:hypothetical protein
MEMGAIKIKRINTSSRSSINIKRKRVHSEDSSAMVSLNFIKGNKKITQSRKIYNALLPKDVKNTESISIHLNRLTEEFLGLKKAYIFDEISMDIELSKERITRRKLILSRK